MRKVLRAVCNYDSRSKEEIGYTQGMNFIVAILLQVYDLDQTFWIFCYLVYKENLLDLYSEGFPLLGYSINKISHYISSHFPALDKMLSTNGISLEFFIP
jgi:hypothetical protein